MTKEAPSTLEARDHWARSRHHGPHEDRRPRGDGLPGGRRGRQVGAARERGARRNWPPAAPTARAAAPGCSRPYAPSGPRPRRTPRHAGTRPSPSLSRPPSALARRPLPERNGRKLSFFFGGLNGGDAVGARAARRAAALPAPTALAAPGRAAALGPARAARLRRRGSARRPGARRRPCPHPGRAAPLSHLCTSHLTPPAPAITCNQPSLPQPSLPVLPIPDLPIIDHCKEIQDKLNSDSPFIQMLGAGKVRALRVTSAHV